MKRFLIAFSTYFSATVAFGAPSGDIKQSQHVTSILIPRIILNDVIMNDDKISGTPGATDKMLAKYDSLAGPLGQTKLTSEDIAQICLASGVITEKPECKERVLNPILAKMGKVRFMNVCDGKKSSGGTNHCIDDVFIATKKQNANQYHQDVNISPYTAYGFAIEYAKKQGHDVWCSSEIKDNIVNCTTLDNKHFYSVKFNGTNNTNDSTIEKNLVKGICALFDSKYAIGTFRHQCKMNCGAGTDTRKVIQKFGLSVHDGYTAENHCEIYQPTYTANQVKTYPGYEYMSNTFKSVQTVLDSQLIDVLQEYVKLQGIDVQSFECDYSPKKYSEQMSNGIPTSLDDMLSCKINGIDTDFIFDDLFESKEYERRAGTAALQCILSNGQYGTDRMCRGLTRAQCDEANNKVPGGTRWDEAAELCVLNRADSARKIGNTIQITGGVVLTAGITFATGGGAMIALVAGAGSIAFDAAFIGLERLQILEPASRARAFAEQAQKCEIPIGSKHPSCSQQQVDCAWRAVNDNFARLDEILENLNPDQLSLVSDLMENVTDCLDEDSLSSAVKMSTPKAWDKALNKANAFLLVAGIFIQPEKGVMRITENAPKIARILSRCKMVESVSAKLDNAKYLRIYLNQDISPDDVKALANEFRNNGAYVSTKLYKAEDGTHFMAVAEKDIFKKLDDIVIPAGKMASPELKTVSYIQDELDDFIRNEKNTTFSKWAFSDDDIANINRELTANNKGVQLSRTEDGSVTFVKDTGTTHSPQAKPKEAPSNLDTEINDFLSNMSYNLHYDVYGNTARNIKELRFKWDISADLPWSEQVRLFKKRFDSIDDAFRRAPQSPQRSRIDEAYMKFVDEHRMIETIIDFTSKLEQNGYKFGTKPVESLTDAIIKFGRDRRVLSNAVWSNDIYKIQNFGQSWASQTSELKKLVHTSSTGTYVNTYLDDDWVTIVQDINKADGYAWKLSQPTFSIDIDYIKELLIE
ncbi:MAG: hypothetical protein IJQ90_03335 [Alphaproteobacteria bacterium]|nr:hypothetical protein [Alphaproteobacteria bacterium]